MMIISITFALCIEVASCSWTLNWLLRKPNFLLLSSTWDDDDGEDDDEDDYDDDYDDDDDD